MRGGDPERLIATRGCADGSGVGRVWRVVVVVVVVVGRGVRGARTYSVLACAGKLTIQQ